MNVNIISMFFKEVPPLCKNFTSMNAFSLVLGQTAEI